MVATPKHLLTFVRGCFNLAGSLSDKNNYDRIISAWSNITECGEIYLYLTMYVFSVERADIFLLESH